jgi:hypothetical protein
MFNEKKMQQLHYIHQQTVWKRILILIEFEWIGFFLDNFLYIAIFATIGVFLLIYLVAFGIMCKHPDI